MSLGGFIKKQFIDVIQWTEESAGVLQYRFPMQDMEIQTGAKLTVRESQMAVFVNEGKVADVFATPGVHTLSTKTLPLLTNLKHWDKLFQSPFKSDVYFYSTRLQTNQRWGTPSPITIRDKEFDVIRLRANGVYSYHVSDPALFHRKIAATQSVYTVGELEPHLRQTIVGKVSDAFAESGVPFLDMAANIEELSATMKARVASVFTDMGLTLDTFQVQSLSLPEELQKRLDGRIGVKMVGDIKAYTALNAAESLATPGGMTGMGVGLGAGAAMGKQMLDTMTPGPGAAPVAPIADTAFCGECGKQIPRAAKFCPECGAKRT
jgi:membrane protease subunit (stomatin/prohibitin family)